MEEPAANKKLVKAIHRYYSKQEKETIIGVLEAIRLSMHEDGEWMIAVLPTQPVFDLLNPEKIRVGDTITIEEDLHFRMNHIETNDGREWIVAFTSDEELEKSQ